MVSKNIKKKLIEEYISGGRSYRELEIVYGVPASTLHRLVAESGLERGTESESASGPPQTIGKRAKNKGGSSEAVDETPAEEIRRLRRELDEARLYGRLMEAMIEIAEEEYEIPIRKKSGAKR